MYLAVDDAVAVCVRRTTVQRSYLFGEDALAFRYGIALNSLGAKEGRRDYVHVGLAARYREYFYYTSAGHIRKVVRVEHDHLHRHVELISWL